MYSPHGHPDFVQALHQELSKSYLKRRALKSRVSLDYRLSSSLASMMMGLGTRFTVWGQRLEYINRQENNQPI